MGGDTSTANSGFAVYKRNVLKGLNDCGLFDVAEVGYGGTIADRPKVPWKYYPTAVMPDDPRHQAYRSNPGNEYGVWRWEAIAVHYKPHIYLSMEDPWQFSHTVMSPLKQFYRIVASPTVDSIPQRQDFLQMFREIDYLYAYTDWAKNYLNEMGLNCRGSIGMGIDPELFKPLDKAELRNKYKLPENAIIFGFVARNQLRKRFPELLKAFSIYLKSVPEDVAKRSYLLLHTSSPDAGWNLAQHLLENNVIHKVLFTYMCRTTGEVFITTYKDDRAYSPFSGELTAFLPNVVASPPERVLVEIYNLMDYYVQCANCEGFGSPMLEAAACNIPLIGTDYSAIGELVSRFGGICVKTLNNFDHNVMAYRSCINPEDFAKAMVNILGTSVNSRELVLQRYTWTHVTDKFIEILDTASNPVLPWNAPLRQYGIPPIKGDMSATQFVHALSSHIPHIKWGAFNLLVLRSMNTQIESNGRQISMGVTPEAVVQKYNQVIQKINETEKLRCGVIPLSREDYLE